MYDQDDLKNLSDRVTSCPPLHALVKRDKKFERVRMSKRIPSCC